MSPRVLVADRSPVTSQPLRDQLAELLGAAVAEVAWAPRELALDQLRAAVAAGRAFDVVVLDADPGLTAVAVRELAAAGGNVRVVLIAGGSDGIALAARCGASDVVMRPLSAAELAFRIAREPAGDARADKRRPRKTDIIIGTGPWIKELYDRIAMVAAAEALHDHSPRAHGPFVVLDCGSIPPNLIESELFGHERGAFTGATGSSPGAFERAHGGTVFLDEIGEMPPPLQGKLLRVLQSQEFRRIGDDQDRRVDVRIVTATNRDLDQLVARGSFRQDLYYRINVFPMHIPPLRDRAEDIALLVHHFIAKHRGRLGKSIEGITPGALRRFASYDFPGNVRELENKVHQAMVVTEGPMLTEADVVLPLGRIAGTRPDITRPFRELKQEAIDGFERQYLTELLREHRGNLARAARAAGMDRKNLWTLVVRHGLDREQFKKP
ncbi:MAG: sigma-54-dependent Fis family transcriptional regulator [Deltaproteobacteria bacterium]|nr:MAG: sigma-54-dependent Fis family transcriptional regulator [Deltaproteobacteria bacterium]